MKWEDIQKTADEVYALLQMAYDRLGDIDDEEIEDPPTEDFIDRVDIDTPLRHIINALYDVTEYTSKYNYD